MTDAPNQPGPPRVDDDTPEPIAVGVDAVVIELPEFEGPLDLLLHLIKKEELEIINIPISLICERYLAYIKVMQALNLDIAAEYLLMAATLAWLKSRELVPPEPGEEGPGEGEDEEVGDPRQSLIRRLLEYQKYKDCARALGERPVMGRNVWGRGASGTDVAGLPVGTAAPLEEVPVFRLIEALEKVLGRAKVPLTHDVVVERISITDRINELVDRLALERSFSFASCFRFLETAHPTEVRHQVVITFLALLEMTRLRMIKLFQASDRGEIYITGGDAIARGPVQVDSYGDDEAAAAAEAAAREGEIEGEGGAEASAVEPVDLQDGEQAGEATPPAEAERDDDA